MESKIYGTKEVQAKATRYYDNISVFYDLVSNWYYKKARNYAIGELKLKKGKTVLNVPCGTGVNFKYFQHYLDNSGSIIGVDLSKGMLDQAKRKIKDNGWDNIELDLKNVAEINSSWFIKYVKQEGQTGVDAIFCDLGLSGFPEWRNTIDNMVSLLNLNGRIVILDWYLEKPSLKGKFVKWIGKGEVDRPLWQYLKTKVADFEIDDSFNYGKVFVASGTKRN